MKKLNLLMAFIPLLIIICLILYFNTSSSYKKGSSNQSGSPLLNVENKELLFNSIEANTVISRLYNSKEFNGVGEVVWRPDIYTTLNYIVSEDGKCYTGLDTIMNYIIKSDTCKAFLLISHEYDSKGNRYKCHACRPGLDIAIFSKNIKGDGWWLRSFKRNLSSIGSWGAKDCSFQLISLGKNSVCLEIKHGIDGNQGHFYGSCEIIEMNPSLHIGNFFNYTYNKSYIGAPDVGVEAFEEETFFEAINDSTDHYPIKLITIRSTNKKTKATTFYKYDYYENQYIKQ